MTLKDLMVENDFIEYFDEIFYENIQFFMYQDDNLNEARSDKDFFDFTKTDAFKKAQVTKYCKYPPHAKKDGGRANGMQVTVNGKAIKAFTKPAYFRNFLKAVNNHLTDHPQNKKMCVKALNDLYDDYRKELHKFNMEGAEKGSAKEDDETCEGEYCKLPGAEEILDDIKKHVGDFIKTIEKAFKGWKTIPVDIPVFESNDDKLNWLFTQNITYRKLLNESSLSGGLELLESNISNLEETLNNMLNEANQHSTKEILDKLREYIRKFSKLIKDTVYAIDELHPEDDKYTISKLNITTKRYKTILRGMDKKVTDVSNKAR